MINCSETIENSPFNHVDFANILLKDAVWWAYFVNETGEHLQISSALQAYFEKPMVSLEDMTGCYNSPMMRIKITEALHQTQEDHRFVVSFCTKKGKTSFQNRLSVIEQNGQKIVWSQCIDISEMVALEREIVDAQGRMSITQMLERQALLEEQNRFIQKSYHTQSRFLALLSHELRSPLLGISSLSERLLDKYAAYPDIVEPLRVIHMTAEQSTYLVSDILTYSQTQYDGMKLRPVKFSLKETLDNIKLLTNSIAHDKGLMVSLIYNDQVDWVVGDSLRLSQVLINLIINGIKFTHFGGVTVEVKAVEADSFLFSVTDSGEGILADKLTQIFEPFAQLENSRGMAQNLGVGLGLFIVKQLVTLMGGEVAVKSVTHVGTTFYFTLRLPQVGSSEMGRLGVNAPISPLSQRVKQKKEHKKQQQLLQEQQVLELQKQQEKNNNIALHAQDKPYKILVADDSHINRMVLSGYLKDLHCQVFEAQDGQQAWSMFQSYDYDYVFLDIQMPYLDGVEVCKRIKSAVDQGLTQTLKGVFAITAGGEEAHVIPNGETFCSIGFNAWLIKPVSKKQIMALFQLPTPQTCLTPSRCQNPVESLSLIHPLPSSDLEGIEVIPKEFYTLMDEFLSELKSGVAQLGVLNKMADWKTLQAKAHYLKGNCMLFQLQKIVQQLRTIEALPEERYPLDIIRKKIVESLENIEIGIKYLENSWAISHNS
ncbi:hybrid sensor histidine kinase/response regulator [Thiomicrorhabdus aquaedulcis]|uniref:ATP-binding response regulator n=1 Tax=Thiomicrorhabdus aquaedulcis TaxID=2211106 RepID=UPI000FDCCFCB|nr:ATP-binding protein [Thiomicrorhabdus aquaedulcis]